MAENPDPDNQVRDEEARAGDGVCFASAVFAVARNSENAKRYESLDLQKLWDDMPVVHAGGLISQLSEYGPEYIDVQVSK